MAQSYFPATARMVSHDNEATPTYGERHSKAEDVQGHYVEQKGRLLTALSQTQSLLSDLRKFNKESWVVRYPQLRDVDEGSASSSDAADKAHRRRGIRRSLSFADDPTFQAEVVVNTPRKGISRSVTLSTIPDEGAEHEEPVAEEGQDRLVTPAEADGFHVFKLDLKLGPHGSSTSPASLVTQLEKASIANLLDERIAAAMAHMTKLCQRVQDTSSKVLVTGDLNAGKSTFVNALLRRDVMPVDQQPCTTAFCEVHDAAENDGKEELHILKLGVEYDINDESTFTRADISELESIVSENENVQQMLKVYLADGRSPSESLLNNGVVDISLIDAPGLNRDSMKTTAVFARQEEIDVVVFVVSAENHFTLSAKEFLFTASNEKAYLFIVVNKYDQIRDKAKCRRLILEQIKQLSPRTYEDAEDLVHFVDSAAAIREDGTPAFDNLESSLRSFVLVKRSKSKLMPASTYLTHLLSDVDLLVSANAIVAEAELKRAQGDLQRSRPILEKMKGTKDALEEKLEAIEEAGSSRTRMRTKEILNSALDRVQHGKLGVDKTVLRLPSYPGLLGLWEYAKEVRRTLLTSLDFAVKLAEDEARVTTTEGVNKIMQLGEEYLPENAERSRRIFMPEAMFSTRSSRSTRRKSSRIVVAGGAHGLGIGLAHRPDMLETTFFDIFDAQYHFAVHFGNGSGNMKVEEEDASLTALSVASLGLGALTMIGGKAFGARGLIEGIVRVTDLFGNESARKWAVPVLGVAAVGTVVYFVLELPNTIPRTVGRRICAQLTREGERDGGEESYVEAHALRVSRETRKVLRLAAWDTKEHHRAAMEEHSREVRTAEEQEKKASGAIGYFERVKVKTAEVRELVESPCT